jgi:hypothetical protein
MPSEVVSAFLSEIALVFLLAIPSAIQSAMLSEIVLVSLLAGLLGVALETALELETEIALATLLDQPWGWPSGHGRRVPLSPSNSPGRRGIPSLHIHMLRDRARQRHPSPTFDWHKAQQLRWMDSPSV